MIRSKLQALAVIVLALMLAIAMPAKAAEQTEGRIAAITPDDFTLTVTDAVGGAHTFALRVDGTVMINDEPRTMWDLRVGDQVTVTYEVEKDGRLVATLIGATSY